MKIQTALWIIGIILVILKLAEVIAWSWWIVLIPFIILFGIFIFALFVLVLSFIGVMMISFFENLKK